MEAQQTVRLPRTKRNPMFLQVPSGSLVYCCLLSVGSPRHSIHLFLLGPLPSLRHGIRTRCGPPVQKLGPSTGSRTSFQKVVSRSPHVSETSMILQENPSVDPSKLNSVRTRTACPALAHQARPPDENLLPLSADGPQMRHTGLLGGGQVMRDPPHVGPPVLSGADPFHTSAPPSFLT